MSGGAVAVSEEVREEWAIRWHDGTMMGPVTGDAALDTIRHLYPGDDEADIVQRTVTIHRTEWKVVT